MNKIAISPLYCYIAHPGFADVFTMSCHTYLYSKIANKFGCLTVSLLIFSFVDCNKFMCFVGGGVGHKKNINLSNEKITHPSEVELEKDNNILNQFAAENSNDHNVNDGEVSNKETDEDEDSVEDSDEELDDLGDEY